MSGRDDDRTRAETYRRQGKVSEAIDAYRRLIETQPSDWTSVSALGDVLVTAGDLDRAATCFARVADHDYREGFLSRASAGYKKVLKFRPADDHALSQVAEVAVRQGMTLEARGYLERLLDARRRAGTERSVAECLLRLAKLDEPAAGPSGPVLPAAGVATEHGDAEFEAALAEVQARTHAELEQTEQARMPRGGTAESLESAFSALRARTKGDASGDRLAVLYEWAESLGRAGETACSLDVLREIVTSDPGYRDVEETVARLSHVCDDVVGS